MKSRYFFLVIMFFLISGCASKSKFVYERTQEAGKGSIVVALSPISDMRLEDQEVDKHYDGDPLKDIQAMLENELLGTGLFKQVVTKPNDASGVKIDMTVEPTLTKLAWEVPGYSGLIAKSVLVGFFTGIVGGVIYGCTDIEVHGDSCIHLLVKDYATGKVLIDKDYKGHHEEQLIKFSCDTAETKVLMAGKALQKTLADIKTDLKNTLSNANGEVSTISQKAN